MDEHFILTVRDDRDIVTALGSFDTIEDAMRAGVAHAERTFSISTGLPSEWRRAGESGDLQWVARSNHYRVGPRFPWDTWYRLRPSVTREAAGAPDWIIPNEFYPGIIFPGSERGGNRSSIQIGERHFTNGHSTTTDRQQLFMAQSEHFEEEPKPEQ